jgi:predicted ATP-dependent Lon-type protease
MDEDRTILEVAVGEGTTLQVVALDYGGAVDVATLGPLSLDGVIDTVKDLAGSIKSAIDTIAPERASVEFGVQVAVKAGKLTALLVEGSGQASSRSRKPSQPAHPMTPEP